MKWNWQQADWPNFRYIDKELEALNNRFLNQSGYFFGTIDHISQDERERLTIDLLCDEAYKTSEIEGEYLNRDSLRSSIRRQFGLFNDGAKISPREQGIAEVMVQVYQTFSSPLSHESLCEWHLMLTRMRRDLFDIGNYRTHADDMEIVSGSINKPKTHFVAPPSKIVPSEMTDFIKWYNKTAPGKNEALPTLIRAGIAHIYFVSIHPFEDGNGRIGRALVEKILSQSLRRPTLIALSNVIQANKKSYYAALEQANKSNEITEWLFYFAKTILSAQAYTLQTIEFLIKKTKFYDQVQNSLNDRQKKVINRLFKTGLEGFKGGLSAENYLRITQTSRATATRDLQDMVDKGILTRTGERKSTRYHLNLD